MFSLVDLVLSTTRRQSANAFQGLLSLAVEFFRTKSQICKSSSGGLISLVDFNYGTTNCSLVCTEELGPFSPMRTDAANNIYVIPAPTLLTFGTATLLCAACCIPAILTLISMWNKILEINWKSRFTVDTEKKSDPEEKKVKAINSLIKRFLNVIEAPLFGLAVVVILILGEINLFSRQVRYQTEPIASIGQWAPIVGTGLAVMGSLVVYLTTTSAEPETDSVSGQAHDSTDDNSVSNSSYHGSVRPNTHDSNHSRTNSNALTHVNTQRSMASTIPADRGGRRKVAQFMSKVGDYMGTPGHGQFDTSSFRRDANTYPTIPGEQFRAEGLTDTERRYNSGRLSRSASRASDVQVFDPSSHDYAPRRSRSDSIGARSIDSQDPVSTPVLATPAVATRDRRDTLEVPSLAHMPSREMLERSRSSTGQNTQP